MSGLLSDKRFSLSILCLSSSLVAAYFPELVPLHEKNSINNTHQFASITVGLTICPICQTETMRVKEK